MAQLPSAAAGSAAFAVLVAVIGIFCGLIMLWLTWQHERHSYVALLSWFAIITTVVTLVEQIYYIIGWRDIFTADAVRRINNLKSGNPHLWIALTFGLSGLDLAFFWIMMCGYTIQALLIMFWAVELASSVYGLLGKSESQLNKLHQFVLKYGKIMAIALPVTDVLLLQIPVIENTDVAWVIMTHSIFICSVTISIVLLSFILLRYLGYRKRLQSSLGSSQDSYKPTPGRDDITTCNTANHYGLYDRWLLPRFGSAIVFLLFFEIFNISMQVNNWRIMLSQKDVLRTDEILSAGVASWLLSTSTPRSLPGIGLLLVFGTTKIFRARLYKAFWPKRWQRHDEKTPLNTPYQSSQAGRRRWCTQVPRLDLRLTSTSLRWNHGDQTFAAWESRPLETRPHGAAVSFHMFGSTTLVTSSPREGPASPWKSSFTPSPGEQDFLHWLSTEDEGHKGFVTRFNVTAPLPTRQAGAGRHGRVDMEEAEFEHEGGKWAKDTNKKKSSMKRKMQVSFHGR